LKKAVSFVNGLPHRLEKVAEIDGVTFINDSAATMPDATIAALKALKDKTIVHILGGNDKALEFEELAYVEGQLSIRALVFLPGTVTEKMKRLIASQLDVPMINVTSMNEAVLKAKQAAQEGDVVLLSPGATSFGLFLHEFDRGDKYRQAVLALQ
jgi:UDP-N-acetylmuramoylalanine--D-glutamate ligase